MDMTYDKRAYYYIVRKCKKSFLLGLIFVTALLLGLIGTSLLRLFDDTLIQIGKQSQAKIILFMTDMKQLITDEHINELKTIDNMNAVNRVNELAMRPYQFEISVGNDEALADSKVRLQGYDDLMRGSLFAQEVVKLESGTLDIKNGEVVIHEWLAMWNGLTIGDELMFENEQGELASAIVRGIYTYIDTSIENEPQAPSMFRFENLIFTHPDFINERQGSSEYIEVHFYVTDPNRLVEMRPAFEQTIGQESFGMRISDVLFRKMSMPLLQAGNTITMILVIIGVATSTVTSLILALWSRERKQEVAVLLSMGKSKREILMQRLLEIFSIYVAAFAVVLVLFYLISPSIGSILYERQLGLSDIEPIQVVRSVRDVLRVFLMGTLILVTSLVVSCMSMMRLLPREMLSSMN